jgi:hypothetical protein
MAGALVDDVFHGDFSFTKSRKVIFGISSKAVPHPPIFDNFDDDDDDDDTTTKNLERDDDGLIVEVCSTFATDSDTGLVGEASETLATEFEAGFRHSSVIKGSSRNTTPLEQMTTNATGRSQSSQKSDVEPSGFLDKFFPTKHPFQQSATKNDFAIEEITIADDSMDEKGCHNSTMDDSEDQSEFTDSFNHSVIYEASTARDSTGLFVGSTSSVSLEESLVYQSTNQTNSFSHIESRELSVSETRDHCEAIRSFMSTHTMDENEDDEEEEDEEEDLFAPKTMTMKVSEFMIKLNKIDQEEQRDQPELSQQIQPQHDWKVKRKWLPWQRLSKREKGTIVCSGNIEMIHEADKEVSALMEHMNIGGGNVRSIKRQKQEVHEPRNLTNIPMSMLVTQAFCKAEQQKEITSLKRKNHKRFMPWNRRSSFKDHAFVTRMRVKQSRE